MAAVVIFTMFTLMPQHQCALYNNSKIIENRHSQTPAEFCLVLLTVVTKLNFTIAQSIFIGHVLQLEKIITMDTTIGTIVLVSCCNSCNY